MQQAVSEQKAPVMLRTKPLMTFTDNELYHFCQINKELKIEKNAEGNLEIMSPTGGESGWRNTEILTSLNIWARKDGNGVVFDSSTGFVLPDGAMRSPDASWIRRSRLSALTDAQKRGFIPLCPDFLIELRSFSDRIRDLQDKMEEYIKNGTELGWLIDPENRQLFVYRQGGEPEKQDNPETISGEKLLPGFVLYLSEIWETGF
ncbi:MAG: Uma2 family endonuclease [Desulfococcaceae bacterium]|jgi:Uma2 family endonuclease|nr:Uma2 family endonuclease [Desulfococcaceae bacterium]